MFNEILMWYTQCPKPETLPKSSPFYELYKLYRITHSQMGGFFLFYGIASLPTVHRSSNLTKNDG